MVRKRGGALMEWGELKRVGAVEVCTKWDRARGLNAVVTTRGVLRVGWKETALVVNQRLGVVAGDCTWRVQQPRERPTGRTRRGARGENVNSGERGAKM